MHAQLRSLHHVFGAATRASSSSTMQQMSWLDLRGLGLSVLERLSIEELLLRHDPLNRCWGIVGCHEPVENRILDIATDTRSNEKLSISSDNSYGHEHRERNNSCAIILGIGGKIDRLVNMPAAKRDDVLILRRFSGGGTVVVDHNSLWTTFIGRNTALLSSSGECIKPFPREIMSWSADTLFGPAFDGWNTRVLDDWRKNGKRSRGRQTLVFQGKSCGISGGVGESLILPVVEQQTSNNVDSEMTIPKFHLRENDYVLGERKMGGNAQSIVSSGFLHHTSFLWDYDNFNMEYLTLPEKRPTYRGDRSHDDFLIKLKEPYGSVSTKYEFFDEVKTAAGQTYELKDSSLNEVLDIANKKFGSLNDWFNGKCRTKIVNL